MIVTTAAGLVGYGVCLGTGFQISYWLTGLWKRAVQFIKERYTAAKQYFIAKVDVAFQKVDAIAKKYPDIKWTDKAKLELAAIFARIVWGRSRSEFYQIIESEAGISRNMEVPAT
jgi:hypothetical protein